MQWLTWLRWLTVGYITIGTIVGFVFFALAGFDIEWNWDSAKIFLSIILLWPMWVWFMVVMWFSYRQRG